ncbi:PIB2 [Candida theae]|uniref:PIB2 n=1 Tax=Candida theae TaxID=1198502 RepID=A0AAD5BC73_9ASCO|nr:PIB2 [Candida theae]KAI5950027.1 PIB2 [Candida theae]
MTKTATSVLQSTSANATNTEKSDYKPTVTNDNTVGNVESSDGKRRSSHAHQAAIKDPGDSSANDKSIDAPLNESRSQSRHKPEQQSSQDSQSQQQQSQSQPQQQQSQQQQSQQQQSQQQQLPSPNSSHHSNNSNSNKDDSPQDRNGDKHSPTESYNKSDLMFSKKDLSKSRTQSYQSVLSLASLKSLKQHQIQPMTSANATSNQPSGMNGPGLLRNNSTKGHNNQLTRSNSAMNTLKNFQSFIQAPVLSSLSTQKSNEELQIGQQLPFHDKPTGSKSRRTTNNSSSNDGDTDEATEDNNDEEILSQQRDLTLNALKKLSLSPRPITNSEDVVIPKAAESESKLKSKGQEPYQPAEVDLSSFASLTRQPKVTPKNPSLSTSSSTLAHEKSSHSQIGTKSSLESLPEGKIAKPDVTSKEHDISQYHHNLRQQQMDSLKLQTDKLTRNVQGDTSFQLIDSSKQAPVQQHVQYPHAQQLPPSASASSSSSSSRVPAAVIPPQDINTRRKPSNTAVPQQLPTNNLQVQCHLQQPQPNPHHKNPSTRSTRQLQQIKGLRTPMYIPAVLRMTHNGGYEYPNRSSSNSPDMVSTPPTAQSPENSYEAHLKAFGQKSINSSTASIKSTDSSRSIDSTSSPKYGSFNRFLSTGNLGRSFDYSASAPPTRRHWVKDEAVTTCGIPSCNKSFNFFERRHHCRKCGGIFCKEHTSHSLYINRMAQFTTGGRGTLSKVCDNCIGEYNEFIEREFGVNISNTKSPSPMDLGRHVENNVINGVASSPKQNQTQQSYKDLDKHASRRNQTDLKGNIMNGGTGGGGTNNTNRADPLVGSVPANWTWSSF